MPDKSIKKQTNDIELPSLPTLTIEGRAWEYRANSPEFFNIIQDIQKFQVKDGDDAAKIMTDTLKHIKKLMTTVFVKGDELYKLVDQKYNGDILMWIKFTGVIAQTISKKRNEELTADLERFTA